MKHNWKREIAKDHHGNSYPAYLCQDCTYLVVAFNHTDLRGGSKHLPNEKIILIAKNDLTPEDAEHACQVYGVECVHQH